MAYRWPAGTEFKRMTLDVEDRSCPVCGRYMHVCDHRYHHLWTLQGPTQVVNRLVHCPDPSCESRGRTFSPEAELSISMPRWCMGWDVFCWLGHRRFARHWSVPQLRLELKDTHWIRLSDDAIENYIGRYQTMLAARQPDPKQLVEAYRDIESLVLTIDGLQPEKGHETLYVVRELGQKRVWFAEPLLSSSEEEIRRLFVRAREMAAALNQNVSCWMSDKQEAFVKGIAAEFVGGDAELAQDNLSLERWFRLPKSHERRIHGHRHAGVRLVQEGPTLALALDAHLQHPEPFTPAELHPYRRAQPPPCQCEAIARRKTMRKARSTKQRPLLLAELEARYLDSS